MKGAFLSESIRKYKYRFSKSRFSLAAAQAGVSPVQFLWEDLGLESEQAFAAAKIKFGERRRRKVILSRLVTSIFH